MNLTVTAIPPKKLVYLLLRRVVKIALLIFTNTLANKLFQLYNFPLTATTI